MANVDGSLEKAEKLMPEVTTERTFECGTCGSRIKAATPTAACNGLILGVMVKLPPSEEFPKGKVLVYTDGSKMTTQDEEGNDVETPWRVPDGEPVIKRNSEGSIFNHDGTLVLNKEGKWQKNTHLVKGMVPGEHAGVEMKEVK